MEFLLGLKFLYRVICKKNDSPVHATSWSSLGLCVVDLLMKQAYHQSGQCIINHPCGGYTCTKITDLSYDRTLQLLWTTWELQEKYLNVLFSGICDACASLTIPSLALVYVCECS